MMIPPSTVAALLGLGIAVGLASDPAGAISREVRGTTNTSVNRNVSANRNVNVNQNVNVNRDANVNRNVNVNRDVNVNRNVNVNNVNVNRNVNVDVDVHGGYCCYHPVATAAAVTTAAVATAAVVGSVVHALPPACSVTVVNGVTYQNCSGTWYQPQYVGTSVQYVVVTAPR